MPSVQAASSPELTLLASVKPKHCTSNLKRWQVGALVVIAFAITAGYMYFCLNRGWLPQDDGLLAQSALRVSNGQLPHRDFVDNYTGGLNYLHALAFWCFGTKLTALRYCVFLMFVAWLPAVFYLCSRVTSVPAAAGMMVLAAVWTLPIYPAAMPSWYNLVFAVFGAAALFRYLEVGTRRWLFVAGVCGGLSFLVKVIGLYYAAAVLLFFIFREQSLSTETDRRQVRPSYGYQVFSVSGLLGLVVVIVILLRHGPFGAGEIMHFVLPTAALVALLIAREWRIQTPGNWSRFAALLGMAAPFTAGLLIPIGVYLVPYARSGSLGAFGHGVFALGLDRASGMATVRPASPVFLLFSIPLLLLLARALYWRMGLIRSMVVTSALATMLLVPKNIVWRLIWLSASEATPATVLLGAAVLLFTPPFADNLSGIRRQHLFLILALAAICGLVQFPFAAPIYFFYFAPLTAFALCALISTRKRPASRYVLASVLAFYALFGVFRVQPSRPYYRWFFPNGQPGPQEPLRLPRSGGLNVEAPEVYERAVDIVQQHASNGLLIATPESPEMYFLTGLRNPTRDDGDVKPEYLLPALRTEELNVVVIKESHTFAPPMPPALRDAIASRLPHSTAVANYTIYWNK